MNKIQINKMQIKNKTTEREVAVRLLIDITGGGAYGNIELRKRLGAYKDISAGFVTELVNGVVRNLIYIDHVIGLYSKTKISRIKLPVLCVLRTGIYQILFMDRVPDSAACNESVKLVKNMGFYGLSGYVNGVLRTVARSRDNITMPDAYKDPAEYLSVKYSYPSWLIKRFMNELDTGALNAMLEANSHPPGVDICVNTMRIDPAGLAEILRSEGVCVSHGLLCPIALRLSHMPDIRSLDSFKQGFFHVMSESSMLAIDALDLKPGDFMIDACAAPGGKSFYAAIKMNGKGRISSRDIHEHRLKLIADGAARLGLGNIRAEPADASITDPAIISAADRLLIDAPCSGLGMIRKKPDIKYSKSEADIRELAAMQRNILAACQGYLKPGGLMVYSTCTLTREENIENIRWFTERFAYHLEPASELFPGGYISLVPSEDVTDGFFIARLRKD